MQAGRLRHRITIYDKAAGQDSFGEPNGSTDVICTVWASVEPIYGREYIQAQAMQAQVDYRVKMRYHDGIKPDMRVAFDNRTLLIMAVINFEERGAEMHLMCREVVK